jgi:hypothetical protein
MRDNNLARSARTGTAATKAAVRDIAMLSIDPGGGKKSPAFQSEPLQ